MENNELFLSIVIPAYNEEKNIFSTLEEVAEYLNKRNFSYEVIVIDDGSRDKTKEEAGKGQSILNNFNLILSTPNKGKGYVLRKAMLQTKGKYVMFMDADNATSIYELDKFLPYLREEYDVVIGSRRLKGAEIVVSESPLRIFMGNVYIVLSKLLIGVSVSDFNCGFKAYRREAAKKIFSKQKMNDWSFDTELIFLLNKFNMKIKEIPVKWEHKSDSKVRPLRAGIESFLSLIKIKWTDISGKYE